LGGAAVDTKLVERIRELDDAKANLQKRFDALSNQCKAALRDNAELRANLETTKTVGSKTADELKSKLVATSGSAEERLAKLQKELKDAQDQMNMKINSTPQFKQLQKLVTSKNRLLREYRAKLQQYEPDAKLPDIKDDD